MVSRLSQMKSLTFLFSISEKASLPACFGFVKLIDVWTTKTPNPKCRLFYKIDLLTDFAAVCLTDFIDWRYIHSWLVFSTQLVICCPHGRRNYTCVLLPLYLLSNLPPPPLPKLNVQYIQTGGCGGMVGGILNRVVDHILQEFYTMSWLDSEPTKLLHHP